LIVGRQQQLASTERERTLRIYPNNVKALDMKQLKSFRSVNLEAFTVVVVVQSL
jgi:hypothetical protein